jgi:hypothetical protein
MLLRNTIFYIIFLIIAIITTYFSIFCNQTNMINILPPEQPALKVVLVPLDSRPPCTKFVMELGKLVNIKVIIPPAEILDNYNTPANKQALREWLETAAKSADAAIISSDILIHGSLLASRLAAGTDDDISKTIKLLKNLHQQNTKLKMYAFSIIPRVLIA